MGKREERHRRSKLIANREDARIAGEIASLTADVGRVGTLVRALLLSAKKNKKTKYKDVSTCYTTAAVYAFVQHGEVSVHTLQTSKKSC